MVFYQVEMSDEEKKILETYSALYDKTISDVLLESFKEKLEHQSDFKYAELKEHLDSCKEKLEDEIDIKCADEAYALFLKDPATISSKELLRKYVL